MNTKNIKDILHEKYVNKEFRNIGIDGHAVLTVEIQNANFEVDKPYIIREPNYEYFARELNWYISQSLNVNDIEGKIPQIWKNVSDVDGFINSNYGWCIWSDANFNQYKNCLEKLKENPHTRQAVMIYNRPSMQMDYNLNGRNDFMCTYSVQCFINEVDSKRYLDYIVYMRSNDAVFGFNNDSLWHMHVQKQLVNDLKETYPNIEQGKLFWNAGSLHVYERHFKFLE